MFFSFVSPSLPRSLSLAHIQDQIAGFVSSTNLEEQAANPLIQAAIVTLLEVPVSLPL